MTNKPQHENSIDILLDIKKQFVFDIKLRLESFFDSLKGILYAFEQNSGEDYIHSLNNVALKDLIDSKFSIEKEFLTSIESAFIYFGDGNYDFFINENLNIKNYQKIVLKQNEEDEMAIVSMLINKSDKLNYKNLDILGNMFSELTVDKTITVNQIPISPFVLVNSLINCIENLDLNIGIRMIVYHAFEVNVLTKMVNIYKNIIKNNQDEVFDSATQCELPEIKKTLDSKYRIIRKLFDMQYKTIGDDVTKNNAIDKETILKSLNLIQQKLNRTIDSKVDQHLKPKELKSILIKVISGKNSQKIVEFDRKTTEIIKLVQLIFDYIGQDESIPIVLKSVLMRLQVSVLKIAIQDLHFLKYQTNPMRQLMNQMAYFPEGFSEELNIDNKYVIKLEEIAAVILIQKKYNFSLYENLLEELNYFSQKMKKRFIIIQKRGKEKAVGLEKITQIKQKVSQVLQDKMHDKYMPVFIRDLLLSTWKNVMVIEFLRHPEESNACKAKVDFIDLLLSCSGSNSSRVVSSNDIKLISLQYSQGLDLVAFNAKDMIDKNNELISFLIKIHKLEEKSGEIKAVILANKSTEVVQFVKSEKNVESVRKSSESEDSFDKKVLSLKVGSWLELTDEEGSKVRVKISWLSPVTGRYLLVNSKGVRLFDKSAEEIAEGFRESKVHLLYTVPLLDRAMLEIAKNMMS